MAIDSANEVGSRRNAWRVAIASIAMLLSLASMAFALAASIAWRL